jgi:hypothetical protein
MLIAIIFSDDTQEIKEGLEMTEKRGQYSTVLVTYKMTRSTHFINLVLIVLRMRPFEVILYF